MSYQRLIMHYGYDQTEFLGVLSDEAVAGCWFDLHRQGGCGAGELRLKTEFAGRQRIQPGEWIACEYGVGARWYLGRVERVDSESPAGVRVQLEGPAIELNEVYPGSLLPTAAGVKPHLYAREDYFSDDPDRALESMDVVLNTRELIERLLQQYVLPRTRIRYEASLVETGPAGHDVTSLKLRGEETVRSVLKDLAVRARNASWGVDAEGRFFFLQSRATVLASYRENIELTRLTETRSRDRLYNRLMLTGDYVYDRRDNSQQIARRSYRWRGNYRHTGSVARHGERRLRLWVPWIRTQADARAFATEFFRIYADPAATYLLETKPRESLPWPWLGSVELRDRAGDVLATLQPESLRVRFDREPWFRLELGPADPQQLWPEPPHDERWELPEHVSSGFGGSDYETLHTPSLTDPENQQQTGQSQVSGASESGSSHASASSESSLDSEPSESSAPSEWCESSSEMPASSGVWGTSGEPADSTAEWTTEWESSASSEFSSSSWDSGATASESDAYPSSDATSAWSSGAPTGTSVGESIVTESSLSQSETEFSSTESEFDSTWEPNSSGGVNGESGSQASDIGQTNTWLTGSISWGTSGSGWTSVAETSTGETSQGSPSDDSDHTSLASGTSSA